MTGYDPNTLPFDPDFSSTKKTSRVRIDMQFEIFGIEDINVNKGHASVKASLSTWFNDTSMTWNASDYGGVEEIMLGTDPNIKPYTWTPDLIIREDCGNGLLSNMKLTQMLVRSNGSFSMRSMEKCWLSLAPT
jgi:Neurotransmitter-gated ion-channel ligand binding domain